MDGNLNLSDKKFCLVYFRIHLVCSVILKFVGISLFVVSVFLVKYVFLRIIIKRFLLLNYVKGSVEIFIGLYLELIASQNGLRYGVEDESGRTKVVFTRERDETEWK